MLRSAKRLQAEVGAFHPGLQDKLAVWRLVSLTGISSLITRTGKPGRNARYRAAPLDDCECRVPEL
jgi:hypothetical protein